MNSTIKHLYGYTLVGPLKLDTTPGHAARVDRILAVMDSYSPSTWGDEDNDYRHLSWSEDDADLFGMFVSSDLEGAVLLDTLKRAWEKEEGKLTLSRQLSDTERVVTFGALLYPYGGCEEPIEFRLAQLFEKFKFFTELGIRELGFINAQEAPHV